jgi:hypothetical protein
MACQGGQTRSFPPLDPHLNQVKRGIDPRFCRCSYLTIFHALVACESGSGPVTEKRSQVSWHTAVKTRYPMESVVPQTKVAPEIQSNPPSAAPRTEKDIAALLLRSGTITQAQASRSRRVKDKLPNRSLLQVVQEFGYATAASTTTQRHLRHCQCWWGFSHADKRSHRRTRHGAWCGCSSKLRQTDKLPIQAAISKDTCGDLCFCTNANKCYTKSFVKKSMAAIKG